MRRGFKTWAEQQSVTLRHQLGLPAHAPLPAGVLAQHLAVAVVAPGDVPGMHGRHTQQLLWGDPDSWSAVTVEYAGCIVVIHNTSHGPHRQQSNQMHELAHLLCQHRPARMMPLANLPLILRTYDAEQEAEAGWLGGCLQLPRTSLLWALQQGMDEDHMCTHFDASKAMVRLRRQTTGVDTQLAWRRVRW